VAQEFDRVITETMKRHFEEPHVHRPIDRLRSGPDSGE